MIPSPGEHRDPRANAGTLRVQVPDGGIERRAAAVELGFHPFERGHEHGPLIAEIPVERPVGEPGFACDHAGRERLVRLGVHQFEKCAD